MTETDVRDELGFGGDDDSDILYIPSRELLFKLRPPHTVQSIRADATIAAGETWPWLCRRGLHLREKVGEVYFPDDDIVQAALVAIASSHNPCLLRCKRCRHIQTREH